MKLSTVDTTTINPATREESTALHEKMASDEDMRAVTRAPLIGKRQTEMAKKNPVTNMEVLSMYLQSGSESNFDPILFQTYEIPSVMVMATASTYDEDGSALSYHACEKCKFKKHSCSEKVSNDPS